MRSAKTEVGGLFVTLALTLAACAGSQPGTATQNSGSATGTATATSSTRAALDQEHLEAQAALDRWASAVSKAGGPPWFSVDPTLAIGQIGAWETAMGSDGKIAVYAG
ncbi:MAG: hypothetical protein E6J50_00610, partial [Chloroflexi bacterium]